MDISDLSSEPLLAVKPLRRGSAPRGVAAAALSSFEALYDKTELEDVPGELALGGEQMSPDDRFQGHQVSKGLPVLSSFENIYELPVTVYPGERDEVSAGSRLPAGELPPGARWSAPADSLEPPVLVREEFDQRYGAVREKIEGHFSDITELVGKEDADAVKAKKGQGICGAPRARFACLLTLSRIDARAI